MIEVKLEPCPFCGGGAHVFPSNYADVTLWNARCTKCYAAHDGHKKPKDAVAKWNTRAPHPSHAAVEAMAQALEKARPILESELQSMCESYCPPCKEGDVFDYSKLKQPELGWITATEEALDNTDAALDAYRATQNKDVRP